MHVNPYNPVLLNTVMDLLDRPPVDLQDVAERWIGAGMPPEDDARESDVEMIRDYLVGWRELVDADGDQARVTILNRLLTTYAGPPTVTDHDGSGWHVHYRPEGASLGEILTASTIVAAAQHLTDHGMHRLGRCALEECDRAFVDHSRPGRQRYCSQTCGNRDAVRRHRRAATTSSRP